MTTGLLIEGVSFGYDADSIITDVSLTIPKGSYSLIVGPNGAGKTTLLRLIAGLLTPNKGTITMDGLHIAEAQKQGYVHLVPQIYNKNAAQFPATVAEIVGFSLHVTPHISKKDYKKKTEEALDLVGMTEFANQRVGDLSGGQQQRVMIAQALARNPQYLLLDEPTSGIDFNASAHIFQLLSDLQKTGITIVMVTHDVVEAAKAADTVICMNRQVCYHGDAQGFLDTHVNTNISWHIGG